MFIVGDRVKILPEYRSIKSMVNQHRSVSELIGKTCKICSVSTKQSDDHYYYRVEEDPGCNWICEMAIEPAGDYIRPLF